MGNGSARLRLALAALALLLTGVLAWRADAAEPRAVVRCGDVIGNAASGTGDRYRVVLGVASIPPARIQEATAVSSESLPYWMKAGLMIHAASPVVTVSAPANWRKREAITWGSAGIVTTIRFASCKVSGTTESWNAYAGGFYVDARRECVPLKVTVGGATRTTWFGIGRACPQARVAGSG
jgi:hypothetical protein